MFVGTTTATRFADLRRRRTNGAKPTRPSAVVEPGEVEAARPVPQLRRRTWRRSLRPCQLYRPGCHRDADQLVVAVRPDRLAAGAEELDRDPAGAGEDSERRPLAGSVAPAAPGGLDAEHAHDGPAVEASSRRSRAVDVLAGRVGDGQTQEVGARSASRDARRAGARRAQACAPCARPRCAWRTAVRSACTFTVAGCSSRKRITASRRPFRCGSTVAKRRWSPASGLAVNTARSWSVGACGPSAHEKPGRASATKPAPAARRTKPNRLRRLCAAIPTEI